MNKDQSSNDRRNFLKLAGLGTVGTIAAAASSVMANAGDMAPAGSGKTQSQYRETAHVKKMYDLARF